ncbi:MAG: N-acyl-D-aspartate/D-glutamate deacylase [Candidatus Bathyarchaeota archaeon B26-1]|nr:MAG: N-acyl-D-aspartate/D-glutamate deacylase [Candidatus Bathyarchaeota archaeon B26-1]
MNEEDVHYVIKHPLSMIGSDAVPQRKSGLVHPRCYGTFPRVIRRYVNETRTLTLEEAIRKMTSAPAQRLGLRDRGQIREGFWADITVFNPRTIRDEATYEDPYRYPVGIEYVLVNGTVAVEEGRYNGSLAGKVLRKETEKTTAS